MANDIVLDIGASTLEATREIAKFQGTATKSLGAIESAFGSLKKVAVAAVAVVAGVEIVRFLNECVDGAAGAEKGMSDLAISMQLAGKYSKESADRMAEFASQIQATSTYEDDAVIAASAHIETLARLDEEGLKQATQGAVNLAAAFNIDLNTASSMVGKALEGNTAAFGKMGIQIGKGKTEAEQFSNVMAKLAEFQGVAESKTNTYSGALAMLGNNWGGVKDAIGAAITGNRTVIELIKTLGNVFSVLGDAISKNKEEIGEYLSLGLNMIIASIPPCIEAIGLLIGMFADLGTAVFAVEGPITRFFAAVGREIQFFKAANGTPVTGTAGDDLEKLADNMDLLAQASADMGEKARTALGSAADLARKAAERVAVMTNEEKKNVEVKKATKAIIEETKPKLDRQLNIIDQIIKAERDARIALEKRGKTASEVADIELREKMEELDAWLLEIEKAGLMTDALEAIAEKYRVITKLNAEYTKTSASIGGMDKGFWGEIGATSVSANGTYTGALPREALQGATGLAGQGNQLAAGLAVAAIPIVGQIAAMAQAVVGAMQAIVDFFPAFFDAIGKLSDSIIEWPTKLENSIVSASGKFAEAIRTGLPKIADNIDEIIIALMDAFPAMAEAIGEMMPDVVASLVQHLIPRLPAIVAAWARATILFFPMVWKSMIETILRDPKMQAVGRAIGAGLAQTGGLIVGGIVAAAGAITSLGTRIWNGFANSVGAMGWVVSVLGQRIWDGFWAACLQFGAMLGDLGTAIFGGWSAKVLASAADIAKIGADIFGGFLARAVAATEQVKSIGSDIFDGFWARVMEVRDQFTKMGEDIAEGFKKGMKDAVGVVNGGSFNPGGGGISIPRGRYTGIPGSPLATGGTVPRGFPNDSFFARLTSDEMVIPAGETGRLSRFLDSQERSPQNMVIKLQVGEKDLASVLLNLNRQGFRTA